MNDSNDSGIVWEDPTTETNRTQWGPVVAALKANPMRWAKIRSAVGNATMVTSIRTGRLKDFRPEGRFEARSVRTGKTYDIFARYIGGDDK